jgi:hypothetical protein
MAAMAKTNGSRTTRDAAGETDRGVAATTAAAYCVTLTLPAQDRYRRLVRLVATALAPRASPEQVGDLRARVSRALDSLLPMVPDGATLLVRVEVAGGTLRFRGALDAGEGAIGFAFPLTERGGSAAGAGSG